MSASFVGTASSNNFGNATNPTRAVSLPSGITSAEVVLIFLMTDSDCTMATPSGWTLLATVLETDWLRSYVWYKIGTGSEGSTVNIVQSGTGWAVTIGARFNNVNQADIIDIHGTGQGADGPSICPDVTTTTSNTLIVRYAAGSCATAQSTPNSHTGRGSEGGSSRYASIATMDATVSSAAAGTATYTSTVLQQGWTNWTIGLTSTSVDQSLTGSDTLTVSESKTLGVARASTDSTSATDAQAGRSAEVAGAETLAMGELASIAAVRPGSDALTFTETATLGVAYSRSDSAALSDVHVTPVAVARTGSETVTLAEVGLLTVVLVGAQTCSFSESATLSATFARADTATVTDQRMGAVAVARTGTDSLALAESARPAASVTSSLAVSATDTRTSLTGSASRTDTAAFSEAKTLGATRSTTDAFTLTDTRGGPGIVHLDNGDVVYTDAGAQLSTDTPGPAVYARSATSSTLTGTDITTSLAVVATRTDSVALVEAGQAGAITLKSAADTGALGETVRAVATLAGADVVSTTEPKRSLVSAVAATDTSTAADVGSPSQLLARTGTDTGTLAEVRTVVVGMATTDASTLVEAKALAAATRAADSSTAADASGRTSALVVGVDVASATNVGLVAASLRGSDSHSQTESASATTGRLSTDTASMADTARATVVTVSTDSLAVSDSATARAAVPAADGATVSDTSQAPPAALRATDTGTMGESVSFIFGGRDFASSDAFTMADASGGPALAHWDNGDPVYLDNGAQASWDSPGAAVYARARKADSLTTAEAAVLAAAAKVVDAATMGESLIQAITAHDSLTLSDTASTPAVGVVALPDVRFSYAGAGRVAVSVN